MEAAKQSVLKKKTVFKSCATRLSAVIDAFDNTEANADDLKRRLSKFEERHREFIVKFDALIDLTNEGDVDGQMAHFHEVDELFYKVCDDLQNCIRQCEPEVVVPAISPSPSSSSTIHVKLPTLELPKFSGKVEEWISFHDLFESLINKNEALTDVQRFHYLRSCVKGEAAQAIMSLSISEINYNVAWTTLRNQFENKKLIIETHLKQLFQLPVVEADSADSIRNHINMFTKHLRALEAIAEPSAHTLLIYLSTSKLDNITKDKWEEQCVNGEVPTLESLTTFLNNRSQVLSARTTGPTTKNKLTSGRKTISTNISNYIKCPICSEAHTLDKCVTFLRYNPDARLGEIRKLRNCVLCLQHGHSTSQCKCTVLCSICQKRHNTLLHLVNNSSSSTRTTAALRTYERDQPTTSQKPDSSCNTLNNHIDGNEVLLGTVLINISDVDGNQITVRGLLDSGSQSNIITEKIARQLKLPIKSFNIPVCGLGGVSTNIQGQMTATISSKHTNYESRQDFLITNKITNNLPSINVDVSRLRIPRNIKLADPSFNIPGPIDVLIGAKMFYELLCVGQVKLDGILIQKTKLAWIISGEYTSHLNPAYVNCNITQTDPLSEQLTKFWEVENVHAPICIPMTAEQHKSEGHFKETVRRDQDGRFIVQLPFNDNVTNLGSSKQNALYRFRSLERKLIKNPSLMIKYSEFMSEYENLGHMSQVVDDNSGFYLPHHAVLKETSLTTKLRVVFDGSAKTNTSVSLNETLNIGRPVQDELFTILLRFRNYPIVLTADIEKMYRQILVDKKDCKYQKILWRSEPSQEIRTYELRTVTYGTSCAPFLATRCLAELADQEINKFPRACNVLRSDFYVDDCITGCDTAEQAAELKAELINLLSLGGFNLTKWRSNSCDLIDVPGNSTFIVNKDTRLKTLGLLWDSATDTLHYSCPPVPIEERVTKRHILSYTSQLFDPLGLLGPIIISAKIVLQQLWQLALHWDESVPSDICTMWSKYINDIPTIEGVSIPRRITNLQTSSVELHGFCDASERAYGACVYLKICDSAGKSTVQLLCAKSRVAPLKTLTIPRLELCSAVVLANLVKRSLDSLNFDIISVNLWSDSTIVLAWLRSSSSSSMFKIFVANRISEINELLPSAVWRHVRTAENPADIISRGMTPTELLSCKLWWDGPSYLRLPSNQWPILENKTVSDPLPELKTSPVQVLVSSEPCCLFTKYSTFSKLRRVVAYCMRFYNNCKDKLRVTGALTMDELETASAVILRRVQAEVYVAELELLKQGKPLLKSSLLSLNPFVGPDGLLRVGGRLQHSHLTYNQRHPIILPPKHHVTAMIIHFEHLRHLHAGARAILAALRYKYWPIGGKNAVTSVILKCMRCCKAKPKTYEHLMGDLPASRINPARAFSRSGLDFCGPFHIKANHRRGVRTSKAYVAVFVCFVSKAVHLELVCDLTTEACLNAIKRFIARRGIVSELFSDNGTNLVGANNEITKLARLCATSDAQESLAELSIKWRFLPPRSPHFGGLWEAAVRSAKHHLYRVAGLANLTYEEMITLLAQIEACLNSRPLLPLSQDIDDLDTLTPGHFLIGQPLTALPEPSLVDIKCNKLSHWQRVQQLFQHFWKKWSEEYLHQLQQRTKWKVSKAPLDIGALVTIRDENLPPLRWRLGRVLELHPGKDLISRVATVRTSSGTVKVAMRKLCLLPCDLVSSNESDLNSKCV